MRSYIVHSSGIPREVGDARGHLEKRNVPLR